MLLTGTPVQNNLRELYSLLVLVDKRRFHLGEFDAFLMKYGNTDSGEGISEIVCLFFFLRFCFMGLVTFLWCRSLHYFVFQA